MERGSHCVIDYFLFIFSPSEFDTQVVEECKTQPQAQTQQNQYGYEQQAAVQQQTEFCRNFAYQVSFTVKDLDVAVSGWNKLLFSVGQNTFLSSLKREFGQTWQTVYQGQLAVNEFQDLALGFYQGKECSSVFTCQPNLDSNLCITGMTTPACNEEGRKAKVDASMKQLTRNEDGQDYSRALETEFRLVGYQITTIETEVQFMLMSVLTKELNMPPGSLGVVAKAFALRKELHKDVVSNVVYVSLQVRTTDAQVTHFSDDPHVAYRHFR
jgi:hypothetical protein